MPWQHVPDAGPPHHMIFERRYQTFLSACQDIVRRRERLAKPVIGDLLLQEVDASVPNHALISHIMAEALLRRIDRNLVEAKNIYLQRFEISQIDLFYLMTKGNPLVAESHELPINCWQVSCGNTSMQCWSTLASGKESRSRHSFCDLPRILAI